MVRTRGARACPMYNNRQLRAVRVTVVWKCVWVCVCGGGHIMYIIIAAAADSIRTVFVAKGSDERDHRVWCGGTRNDYDDDDMMIMVLDRGVWGAQVFGPCLRHSISRAHKRTLTRAHNHFLISN